MPTWSTAWPSARRATPPLAEDLAQDAFVRAFRALAGYPPERIRELQLRPWLSRITINLARNRARDRRARPIVAPLEDVVADGRRCGAAARRHRPAARVGGRLADTADRPAAALRPGRRAAPRPRPELRGDRRGARQAGQHREGPCPSRPRAPAGRLRSGDPVVNPLPSPELLRTTAPAELAPTVLFRVGLADEYLTVDSPRRAGLRRPQRPRALGHRARLHAGRRRGVRGRVPGPLRAAAPAGPPA